MSHFDYFAVQRAMDGTIVIHEGETPLDACRSAYLAVIERGGPSESGQTPHLEVSAKPSPFTEGSAADNLLKAYRINQECGWLA